MENGHVDMVARRSRAPCHGKYHSGFCPNKKITVSTNTKIGQREISMVIHDANKRGFLVETMPNDSMLVV